MAAANGWDELLDHLLEVRACRRATGGIPAPTEICRLAGLVTVQRPSTHIYLAARTGHLCACLSAQTDRLAVDAASHIDGYTPLMIAAACGRRHAVDALLARGADPSKRSRRGVSR